MPRFLILCFVVCYLFFGIAGPVIADNKIDAIDPKTGLVSDFSANPLIAAAQGILKETIEGNAPWEDNSKYRNQWAKWGQGVVIVPLQNNAELSIAGLFNIFSDNIVFIGFDKNYQPVKFGYFSGDGFLYGTKSFSGARFVADLDAVYNNFLGKTQRMELAVKQGVQDQFFLKKPWGNPSVDGIAAFEKYDWAQDVQNKIKNHDFIQKLLSQKLTAQEISDTKRSQDSAISSISQLYGVEAISWPSPRLVWASKTEEGISAIFSDPLAYPAFFLLVSFEVKQNQMQIFTIDAYCFTGKCIPKRL